MKIDPYVLEAIQEYVKNGPETVDVNADGKIYHVEMDVYNVFIRNCTESPEDFLTRIKPEDDDAASYLMSRHVNDLLRERNKQ